MHDCSQPRIYRAAIKACLPEPKGCGLFKVSDYACISWWASISQCLADPLLFELRDGLMPFAKGVFVLGAPDSNIGQMLNVFSLIRQVGYLMAQCTLPTLAKDLN